MKTITIQPEMRQPISPIILFALLFAFMSCKNTGPQSKENQERQPLSFTTPAIPQELTTKDQQVGFLVEHYWDNFNFSDTTYILQEVTEQAFVNYIDLFPYAPNQVVENSVATMLDQAFAGNETMFDYFADLYDKYFYDHQSPYRSEKYHILVLEAIKNSQKIDDTRKIRPSTQLEWAMKNRTGEMATDFVFTQKDGTRTKLSEINSPYTILFFNDPDCRDCEHAKLVFSHLNNPQIKVVAIYPYDDVELWRAASYPKDWINGHASSVNEDELYDLPFFPTIYLLDSNKKVIFKEITAEQIMGYLRQAIQ